MLPIDITVTDSNIAENEGTNGTIYPFDVTQGYAKGVQRYHERRLYEARVTINPLAHYSWNDLDPLNKYATNLYTQTLVADPTAVPVTDSVTIVYVYSNETYYIAKVTGDVDFTTEDLVAPADFTSLGTDAAYRYEYLYPIQGSLYWKDLGATNRNKSTDKAINTYSTKTDTTMWFEFQAKSIDQVVLFNIEAQDVTITMYTTDINNPIYTDTKTNILDTTSIVDWKTYSRFEPATVRNIDWILPFFVGTVTIRITLTSDTTRLLRLGEILAGQQQMLGGTIDGIPIVVKSSGEIIEAESGEVIFNDEGDLTKVYEIFNFTIKFDSNTLDATIDKCSSLINRRIVAIGEDSDDIKYRSLVVYGFSRDASPEFVSNNTKSTIKLQVQRFI